MNFEESSYFLNLRENSKKQCHIFGKDFSVKKFKKKCFLIFLKKKYFFDFFLNRFFSWKIDKLDSKLGKTDKNICFRYIKNVGQKITQIEYSKVCESE